MYLFGIYSKFGDMYSSFYELLHIYTTTITLSIPSIIPILEVGALNYALVLEFSKCS
jgi:hypothetical protein